MKTFQIVFVDCESFRRTMYVQHVDKEVLTGVLHEVLSGMACAVEEVIEVDPAAIT